MCNKNDCFFLLFSADNQLAASVVIDNFLHFLYVILGVFGLQLPMMVLMSTSYLQAQRHSASSHLNDFSSVSDIAVDHGMSNPFLEESEIPIKISFKKGSVLFAGEEDTLRPVQVLITLEEDPKKKVFFETSLDSGDDASFYEKNFRFFLAKSDEKIKINQKRFISLSHKIISGHHMSKDGRKKIYEWNFLLKSKAGHALKSGIYDLVVELHDDKQSKDPIFRVISPRSYRIDPPRPGISVFFVVDNSRSMLVNDSDFQRFKKIEEIIFSKKYSVLVKNFSIYSFASRLYEVVPFLPVAGLGKYQKDIILRNLEMVKNKAKEGYHTSYAVVFNQLKKIIEKARKKRKNDHFAVIFLTDGAPTTPFQDEHKQLGRGVPIFTVGLGKKSDEKKNMVNGTTNDVKSYDPKLLKKIAKESGGKFFQANEKMMSSIYSAVLKNVNDYFGKVVISNKKDVYLDQELIAIKFDVASDVEDIGFSSFLSVRGKKNHHRPRLLSHFFYDKDRKIILFEPLPLGKYQMLFSFTAKGKFLERKKVSFRVKKGNVKYSLSTSSAESNLFFAGINPLVFQKRYLMLADSAKKNASFDPESFRFFFLGNCSGYQQKKEQEICQETSQAIIFESSLLFSSPKSRLFPFWGHRRAIGFTPLKNIPTQFAYHQEYAWHGYLVVEQPAGWFVHNVTVDYRLKLQESSYDLSFNKTVATPDQTITSLHFPLEINGNAFHFFQNFLGKSWGFFKNNFFWKTFMLNLLLFILLVRFYSVIKKKI